MTQQYLLLASVWGNTQFDHETQSTYSMYFRETFWVCLVLMVRMYICRAARRRAMSYFSSDPNLSRTTSLQLLMSQKIKKKEEVMLCKSLIAANTILCVYSPERRDTQMLLHLSSAGPRGPLGQRWCEKSTSSCGTQVSASPEAKARHMGESYFFTFCLVQMHLDHKKKYFL